MPKCLQSTELKTSLQHFFSWTFVVSFFMAFFFFFLRKLFFITIGFQGGFQNHFSAFAPNLYQTPITHSFLESRVGTERKRAVLCSSFPRHGPKESSEGRTTTGGQQGRQFTNMVDSSYVGLFLYQNLFKGLKKTRKKDC